MRLSSLYVISGSHGLVKIGVSADPPERLATLQTGSGHHLHLAFAQPVSGDAFAAEAYAHELLAPYRQVGEWFAVPVDVAVAAVSGATFRYSQAASQQTQQRPRWWLRFAVLTALFAPTWTFSTPILFSAVVFGLIFWSSFRLIRYAGPITFRDGVRWFGTLVGAVIASMLIAIPFVAQALPYSADEHTSTPFDMYFATKVRSARGLAEVQALANARGRITEKSEERVTYRWVSDHPDGEDADFMTLSFYNDGNFGGGITLRDQNEASVIINSFGAFTCDLCQPPFHICGKKPSWMKASDWTCD